MLAIVATAAVLLPLSLDTFALASALGVSGLEPKHRLRVALIFTAFEAGMPIAGVLAGNIAGRFLSSWAGYAGIAVLLIAGALLLRSGDGADEGRRLRLLASARGVA